MKGIWIARLLICLGSACGLSADETKIYVRSPDTVRWRLSIDDSSYTLHTGTLEGVVCEEVGSVERSGEKMRFVPSPSTRCPYGDILREKSFVAVVRQGNEFLVTEDQIPELEKRLASDKDRLLWFPFFERVTAEKTRSDVNQRGEPGATDNPDDAQRI